MIKRINKKLFAGTLIGVLCLGLTGCGSKADKAYEDLMSDAATEENTRSNVEVTENADIELTASSDEQDEKKLQGEKNGDGYIITFDAVIEETEDTSLGQGNIMSLNKKEYTEDEVLAIAKKLFDNGEYKAIKPVELCNESELAEVETEFKAILSAFEAENDSSVKMSSYVYETLDTIEAMREADYWDNASDGEGPFYTLENTRYKYENDIWYTYMSGCKAILLGNVDGKPWLLLYEYITGYESSDVETMDEDMEEFPILREIVAFDLANPAIVKTNTVVQDMNSDVAGDKKISDSQMKAVQNYFDIFGLDNYVVSDTKSLVRVQDGNIEDAGFSLVFEPDLGEHTPFLWNVSSDLGYDVYELGKYYGYVSVDDAGVNYIRVHDRYTAGENIGSSELMDVEAANEKMMEFVDSNMMTSWYIANMQGTGLSSENKIHPTVNRVKLENVAYVKTCEETNSLNGDVVCEPAWVYYWISNQTGNESVMLAVSAVDGTIISLYNAVSYGCDKRFMAFDGHGFVE